MEWLSFFKDIYTYISENLFSVIISFVSLCSLILIIYGFIKISKLNKKLIVLQNDIKNSKKEIYRLSNFAMKKTTVGDIKNMILSINDVVDEINNKIGNN